jgi:hypothetical protein
MILEWQECGFGARTSPTRYERSLNCLTSPVHRQQQLRQVKGEKLAVVVGQLRQDAGRRADRGMVAKCTLTSGIGVFAAARTSAIAC